MAAKFGERMTSSKRARFKLGLHPVVTVPFLLWAIPFLYNARARGELFALALVIVFELAGIIYWGRVIDVTMDGIRLYRINFCPWDNISDARLKSLFRLPYLKINRRKGLRRGMYLSTSKGKVKCGIPSSNLPGRQPDSWCMGNSCLAIRFDLRDA
jgi:hypothetical protein